MAEDGRIAPVDDGDPEGYKTNIAARSVSFARGDAVAMTPRRSQK